MPPTFLSALNPLAAGLLAAALALLVVAALPSRFRRGIILGAAALAKRHPLGATFAIALLVVAARLCLLPLLPVPVPLIADEHSNLFLARTLASGRLANPEHPMSRHYETLFILQRPAYASVYPPAQGEILALGLICVRQPWAGVLLSVAAMCAAMAWMLRAYVPRLWALYGGLLAAAGYGILSYWANSYWGGAAAAIGGALVFGALPRLLSSGRRKDAALLGLGCVVLALSRPYEGLLTVLPAAFCVLRNCTRNPLRARIPVLASALLAGTLFIGWYNYRVTGSPIRLPHQEYARQYAAAPAFIWQSPLTAPHHIDPVLRDAHLTFGISYTDYATWSGAARKTFGKISGIAVFYWGPFWALVILAFPESLRERRYRLLLTALALCVAGILLTVGFQLHYAAPCASILLLLLIDVLRRICRQWRRVGAVLVIAAPLAWLTSEAVRVHRPRPPNSLRFRPAIQRKLEAETGHHLVFVRYTLRHPLGQEWVYNDPDIDNSAVVWARDLGPEWNRELREFYPNRQVWLLEPDHPSPRIFRCAPECQPPERGSVPPEGERNAKVPGVVRQ